jgi:hypothetical protein
MEGVIEEVLKEHVVHFTFEEVFRFIGSKVDLIHLQGGK